MLLATAVAAGVPRFIPSGFVSNYPQQVPCLNRNFDLRRGFQTRLHASWQQQQYLLSLFSVQNVAFNNARYPESTWTTSVTFLAA